MIEIVLIYPVLYYQNCLHCRGRHAPIWGAWLWIKTIQNWFSSHFQQTSTICRLFDLSKLSTLACFDSGRMFSSSSSTRHAGQSFKERTKPWSAALHCSKDRRIKLIISNVIDTCQVYASLMTMNDLTCFSCISCGTHTYICICIYICCMYIYIYRFLCWTTTISTIIHSWSTSKPAARFRAFVEAGLCVRVRLSAQIVMPGGTKSGLTHYHWIGLRENLQETMVFNGLSDLSFFLKYVLTTSSNYT